MATQDPPYFHQNKTRITIDFPTGKHKQLKEISALLGIPMKDFILTCVLEKLDDEEIFRMLENQKDAESFDRGMKSIKEEGFDTIEEVKEYLGLNR